MSGSVLPNTVLLVLWYQICKIYFVNVGKMSVTLVNIPLFLFLCRLFINRKLTYEKTSLLAFIAVGSGGKCMWR